MWDGERGVVTSEQSHSTIISARVTLQNQITSSPRACIRRMLNLNTSFRNPLRRTQPASLPSPQTKSPPSREGRRRQKETRPKWAGRSLGRGCSVRSKGKGRRVGRAHAAANPRGRARARARPARERPKRWGRGGSALPLCVCEREVKGRGGSRRG